MSDDTRPMSDVPTLLADRYRLRGSIGQGGMADVQRAHDEQLDREVAVKILHARYADDPNFLLRFRREAQSAASLNHPNIVSVYDAGETDGRPFIVMELVRGRSLRQLTRTERITAGRGTEIVGDAALALNYAHEHGLIHRDIKPGNILISHDGEVKVTDFGIARAVNAETITETAAVFGTAAYVSPEQAQGDTVDRRTDVYSLGCVLYELLAGQQPFHADSPVALAYQHVSAMPPVPSELSDEATPELDAITLKAMAKNRDDRYQTAREFNADLERARAGVAVTAPMAGAWAATEAADRWNDQTVVASGVPAGTQTRAVEQDVYDDDYEDEPRSRAGWMVVAALLLLALLAGGWWLLTSLGAEQEVTAQVPDVVGLQQAEATELLTAQGFTDIQIETVERSGADENEVVAQDPEPSDDEVPVESTTITLTVNSGAPPVEVPDVTDDTRGQARQALNDVGLRVGDVTEETSDTVDEGRVIRTNPTAGTEVPEDTEVDLVISTGSNEAEVPDVVDRLREDAEQALNDACEPQPCFGAFVSEEFSDTVGEGRVIRQSPEGGQQARKGSDVTLVVSLGPEEEPEPEPTTTEVPDVIGDDVEDAQAELQEAGLAIGEVIEQPSDEYDAGEVIATDPEAGDEVEEQTLIAILVSTGPEQTSGDGNSNGNSNGNGGGDG